MIISNNSNINLVIHDSKVKYNNLPFPTWIANSKCTRICNYHSQFIFIFIYIYNIYFHCKPTIFGVAWTPPFPAHLTPRPPSSWRQSWAPWTWRRRWPRGRWTGRWSFTAGNVGGKLGKTMENLGKTMENWGKPWKTGENLWNLGENHWKPCGQGRENIGNPFLLGQELCQITRGIYALYGFCFKSSMIV